MLPFTFEADMEKKPFFIFQLQLFMI